MRRFDCELRVVFGAAIQRVSNHRKVLIEGDLCPHRNVNLLREFECFLRSCHRVVLRLWTKLFCGFVIAAVMCGSGSVGVCSVDMQVRCIVIFALGHRVHHCRGNVPPVAPAVFHVVFEDAEQTYTYPSGRSIVSKALMPTDGDCGSAREWHSQSPLWTSCAN